MRLWSKIAYLVLAAGFIVSLRVTPYPGSFIIKVLPITLLLVAIVTSAAFRGKTILAAAIVFSGAGDAILDLGFQGSFIAGLVSFLIAHLWYIGLFSLDVSLKEIRVLPTLGALTYILAMGVFLWPYLGAMKLPVAVYIAVIAAMLVCALNRRGSDTSVLVGAGFFVLSDSILALNKFYASYDAAGYAIMTTYYAAQYLMVNGVLKDKA